jgi:hypothetical protein
MANSSLLSKHNDAHWRCEDLENDLKKSNADSTAHIAALEATVKSVKTHSVEVAAVGNKRLNDFEAELSRDLTEMRELYVRNILSIDGLCSPMPEGDLSTANYIRWLSVVVGDLLKVFAGVNENFVSITVEGALAMAGNSVDLDAIQDAATASGADIFPMERDVWKAVHAVAKNWWWSFSYDYCDIPPPKQGWSVLTRIHMRCQH